MTKEDISYMMDEKIKMNPEKVVFSFYELRVKHNLSGDDLAKFLRLTQIRLENLNYKVYFSDQTYEYQGKEAKVQPNEMVVAIKKN